jgi:hypothetical protein
VELRRGNRICSRVLPPKKSVLSGFAEISTLDVTTDHGHRHARVRRSSRQAERPRERQRRVVLIVQLASSMGAAGSNANRPS